MFLPRYSILQLLGFVTACCVLFAVAASAVWWQSPWAVAITLSIVGLGIAAIVYGLFFVVAWWASLLLDQLRREPPPSSPLAGESPPPRLIPPRNPET